jgi:DNA-binding HxlR family transcriptional regulator
MQKSMPKISKKILTEQLRELEDDKLILRQVQGRKAPYIVTYTLSERGVALRKLMDDMISWGMIHFKDDYSNALIEEYNFKPPVNKFVSKQIAW